MHTTRRPAHLNEAPHARRERAVGLALSFSATLATLTLLAIVAFVTTESLPALRQFGVSSFFADTTWEPVEGRVGLVSMLVATILLAACATILATPLGVLSALCATFYAPRPAAMLLRRFTELLAGIPSVVIGFWGLVVLVPLIARLEPPGASVLAGIIVLTVMILPLVALFADVALSSVPRTSIQAAAALGLGRGATIRHVVLPAAWRGIGTGVLLACARALGETMAVLMVCGNVVQLPESLLDPVRTLTANIALEMAYAMGDHRSALFVSGLLLLGVVAGLVLGADRLSRHEPAP